MAAKYVLSKTLFPRGAFKNHHRRCRGCGAQPIHRLRTGQLDIAFVAGARPGQQPAACARGHAGGRMGLPTAWIRRPHRLAPRGNLGDPGQPSGRGLLAGPDAGSSRSSATHTRASRPRPRRFLAPPGSAVSSTASTTPLSMPERMVAGWISIFIVTAFAQNTAEAAGAQWRAVANQIRHKVSKLATIMEEAQHDLPTCRRSLNDDRGLGISSPRSKQGRVSGLPLADFSAPGQGNRGGTGDSSFEAARIPFSRLERRVDPAKSKRDDLDRMYQFGRPFACPLVRMSAYRAIRSRKVDNTSNQHIDIK
ncbi:hypothetical protein SAMN04488021_14627 [Paracoccus aminovorans]|uniref:Uncharacterized protein n=1 Tax=Paracoccus aminovorans TaxID=34004 RepID=A0A1I3EAB9_9RHOB|nr:hypothetical protein JCM7685_pAMV3p0608 [Paracoccus aminovorans]SFH95930.1 hypothetical protein SAMN04488021_14627 [Paracoccus aminovorans]